MIKNSNNTMMITYQIVILKISHIHSIVVVILAVLLSSLSLLHHTAVFANHGQEISLTLNSAQFIPVSSGEGNQVKVTVNYSAVNSNSTLRIRSLLSAGIPAFHIAFLSEILNLYNYNFMNDANV